MNTTETNPAFATHTHTHNPQLHTPTSLTPSISSTAQVPHLALTTSTSTPSQPDHPPQEPQSVLDLGWDSPSNVLNLSKLFSPSPVQVQILERGLSFIPYPTKYDWEELQRDLYKYHRRIKIIDYFHSQPHFQQTLFTHPSNWEPDWAQLDGKTQRLIKADRQALRAYRPPADGLDNLSRAERRAITQLSKNSNIIIKPADKGSKIVILDRQQYLLEANRQLANTKYYKPIQQSIQPQAQLEIRTILQSLYHKKHITAKQRDFLFGPDKPRPRQFYLLPKIHKDPHSWTVPFEVPPGRPIVSDCNSASYNISQYIDHYLGPLSTKHPSYLKDTYHFLDTIGPMAVPTQAHLFTIDIDSLYTNINTEQGLRVIQSCLNRYPDSDRPDQELLQLLRICLTNNDFSFNNNHYLQVHGTAMGQRFAPSYANIYMSEWERGALAKCTLQPTFYLRFLDDIIGAWPHDISLFQEFIDTLNSHHPSIQVKHTIDPHQINFLDTTVFFEPINATHKSMLTKVFFKTTDTHSLLHKTSYHPKHTFKGIIKSQIIRFHRISSRFSDFQQATQILFKSLRNRGYSKRFLRSIKNSTLAALAPARSLNDGDPPQDLQMEQPLLPGLPVSPEIEPNPYPNQGLYPYPTLLPPGRGARSSSPNTYIPDPPQLIPFVSTFSHRIIGLHRTIKNNFIHIQSQHPIIHNYKVISAHRKNRSLHNILVRSKFTDNRQIPHTQHDKFYKNRKFIHNPHNGTAFPSLGSFSLTDSNIVYIITCTTCYKHYIGETKHTILTRLKQHLYNIREGRLATPLVTHFQQHSPDHLIISGLESNDRWTSGQRKRAEKLWILKLGTTTPKGLNDVH